MKYLILNTLPFDIQHSLFDIRYFLCFSVSYYTVFPLYSIIQNKAKVKSAKINLSSFITSKYEYLDIWLLGKTKPKQTQSCPPQADSKPKQTQLLQGEILMQSLHIQRIMKKMRIVAMKKQTQFKAKLKGLGEFYLRLENIMLASAVVTHIIAVRNILNCNDRIAKPWSKITLYNPESASRTTFRIISLVLPVLSKERFMHGDSDESLCLSKFEYCIF